MGVNVDVQVEATIYRSPVVVAAFAGDPTNAPRWYANIGSVDWQTPPPVAVGSRMDFVAQFLGRRLAYTYEMVELEPGHRLVMRTVNGPFPMETTYTWESAGTGATRMTLRNRGRPAGFSRLAAPVVKRAIRRPRPRTWRISKWCSSRTGMPMDSSATAAARHRCRGRVGSGAVPAVDSRLRIERCPIGS